MKTASFIQALLVAVLFFGVAAWAPAADPSDSYLHAYALYQDGMKAAEAGHPEAAVGKLRSAQTLIQKISQSQPNWQPALVAYKLQKIENILKELAPSEAQTQELDSDTEEVAQSR